ncbi:class I SAM-dependent methyltransferase [Aliirhizobium smilacinae]|uniref:SAM-dependent methyltransferase n=1 Tax=Aliirhizobium smilacinae TaxID=1395944 RepID=A0A5C4X956_9HYPH|nr:SAM-dependent methyltransferase [Rhizobium smilacinae]TNM59897.1 SAM-dependent methyltransferase [Rhizobium smilacinae]
MIHSDTLPFLRAWISAPLRVGAIVPSGSALARLITSGVPGCSGRVLELGPGTGVFTRALIDRGVLEENLALVEFDPDFARSLALRFPLAQVINSDAAALYRRHPDLAIVQTVISGLPLLSFSQSKVVKILVGTFAHLEPGGAFYQFTYGRSCPVSRRILDRLHLKASLVGKTYSNLPPATVYKITRRPFSHLTHCLFPV